ncbi:hypothetical protein VTK73DRAFT_3212 [Phialemonium thermophilum]|uniref:Uncharacterized protein n=1 Tax=Phialemonium thermophilum TaxID=223376 RepID=A0ABR3VKE6_9PEZI
MNIESNKATKKVWRTIVRKEATGIRILSAKQTLCWCCRPLQRRIRWSWGELKVSAVVRVQTGCLQGVSPSQRRRTGCCHLSRKEDKSPEEGLPSAAALARVGGHGSFRKAQARAGKENKKKRTTDPTTTHAGRAGKRSIGESNTACPLHPRARLMIVLEPSRLPGPLCKLQCMELPTHPRVPTAGKPGLRFGSELTLPHEPLRQVRL